MAKTKNPKTAKGPQKDPKVATGFDRIISEGESPLYRSHPRDTPP